MAAVSRGLSEEFIDVWFLKSFASRQFHLLESPDHDTLAWHAMKGAGLVVSSEFISPYEALRLLEFAELRVMIRCFNLPRARSGSEARRIISNNVLPGDLRSFLNEKTAFKNYWKILPPDGIDWDDFQSWRQQIKGMGEAISDIYSGSLKKSHPDNILLCG
jgi:hypothetical protein